MKKANIFSLIAIITATLSLVLNFTNTCAATHNPDPADVNTSAPGAVVDLTYAAEKALPSVVYIHFLQNSKIQTVEVENDPFSDFFDPFGGFFGRGQGGKQKRQIQTPKKEGAGSGVIISADGYIVTNNHVVAGADELTVTMNDNKEYSAKIIGTDETTDLALIKINAKNLPAIKIADSDKLKVGQWVLAVGNPLGLNNTVTAGIVSAKARSLGANGVESFIQTDAAINAGNSGGALVNTNGDLVGINAMLYSQTGSYSGYGFAIPTTIMNKVVADLKEFGTVQRAMIGIKGSDVNKWYDSMKAQGKEVEVATMEGIHVEEVVEGGAAEQAEIVKDDIITKVDGKAVKKMSELQEAIATKRPGDKISITYLRGKKTITKEVTLRNAQGNTKVVKKAELDILGATFRPINKQEKEDLELNYGLKVTKVESGPMKEAGVPTGFIILAANDAKVTSEEDLQKAVRSASTSKEDQVLYLKGVFPSGKRGYFAVSLEQQ
ncbi:MAG: Do family serine endopeptidase [Bacteroidaceae bacterium]|nr:Do family serine endopeptidase [Bacteroidaceae bacterium]